MESLAKSEDIETLICSNNVTARAAKAALEQALEGSLPLQNRGGRGKQTVDDKNEYPPPSAAAAAAHAKAAKAALPASQPRMLPASDQLSPAAKANLAALAELYRELHNSSCTIEAVSRYMPKLKVDDCYFTDKLISNHQQLEERLSALIREQLSSFYSARG